MKTHSIKFQNTIKSYFTIVILGIAMGIVTRLTDFFPADTLWSFSSIATHFGFWMVTSTLIIYYSSSNINAGMNVFLYLFAMSFSFYFLQYILEFFLRRFDNEGFKHSLFFLYTAMSVVCGLVWFYPVFLE